MKGKIPASPSLIESNLLFCTFSHTHTHTTVGKLANATRAYYGAHLGKLSELHHGVSGDVYAVDSRTLFLKNFKYDGEGPGNIQTFFLSRCY